jgi:hypothetical protein
LPDNGTTGKRVPKRSIVSQCLLVLISFGFPVRNFENLQVHTTFCVARTLYAAELSIH